MGSFPATRERRYFEEFKEYVMFTKVERNFRLALAISLGLVSAKTVTRLAHVAGKGI